MLAAAAATVWLLTAASGPGNAIGPFTSQLVVTRDLGLLVPPSPDPSGITYVSGLNKLVVVDGEVDETVQGITHFQGANVWDLNLDATVVGTGNIALPALGAGFTNEPTGVAWDSQTGEYYVTDDNSKRVYRVSPGADGRLGTGDDSAPVSFQTAPSGNTDPEGIAVDTAGDRLFVIDGVGREVFVYSLTGTALGHFDVDAFGVGNPESVEFNDATGRLFVLGNRATHIIAEMSTTGALLRTIDFRHSQVDNPAGLAYAPASDGTPGVKNFYIVDREVDNNSNPNAVDGKLFEMTAPPETAVGQPPAVSAGDDQIVATPNPVVLDGTVTDPDGASGAQTATWSKVSGPGTVDFGSANAVDTTATITQAGTYVLRLTVSDAEWTAVDEVVIVMTAPGSVQTIDTVVSGVEDDAEQHPTNHDVELYSLDLDLMSNAAQPLLNEAVGLRFAGLNIPQGSEIANAYVQFTSNNNVSSEPTTLTITGQDSDNASAFVDTTFNITQRPTTAASVVWSQVPPWTTAAQAGPDQQTPDLRTIVHQIVNRPGWAQGNALVLVITGTGRREARSRDYDALQAPKLHVEWRTNTAPAVAITTPAANAAFGEGLQVDFGGSALDGGDGDISASLAWSSSLDGPIGTGPSVSTSILSVGTHTITASATDIGGLTGTASINVTITPNLTPVVTAGPDQTVTWPANASLDGTVTDDGLPPGQPVTQEWTKISGPGTVTFGDKNAVDTTASFSTSGAYVLRLTATDSMLSTFDEVTVTAHTAPVVDAGPPNLDVTLPAFATLDGTVSDDGLPAPVGTTWSKVSGPGDVNFGDANAVDTTAAFSAAGTYVLRLTATDTALSAADDVTVTVSNANQAPVVSAGPDLAVTLPAAAGLDGTVTDDGLPAGAAVGSTWSKISGPGDVNFGDAKAVDTTATFSSDGTYVLRLTATDTALSTTDDVTVNVGTAAAPPPPPPPPPPSGGGGGGGGGAAPDLALVSAADRATAAAGETILFRFDVSLKNRTATSGASNVVLTGELTPNAQLVSMKTNRGWCAGPPAFACHLDFLAGTLVASVEMVARVIGPGEIVTSASAKAQQGDPDPSNNVAFSRVNAPAPLTPPTARAPVASTTSAKSTRGVKKRGTRRGETLRGTTRNDILRGLGGNDRLFGLAGKDLLDGGPGKDEVYGGPGNDFIRVRDGVRDVVRCGPGKDVVIADRRDRTIGCERVLRR